MPPADHLRPRRTRQMLWLCLAGTLSFAALAVGVERSEPLAHVDTRLSDALRADAHAHPLREDLFEAVTWAGAPETMTALTILAALAFWRGRYRRLAAAWVVVMAGTGLFIEGFKDTFQRERPSFAAPYEQLPSYSFPSGHSAGSVAGYGLMAYCLALRWPGRRRRLGLVVGLGLVVLLIGFSRIYLGRHFLSDVLAGFALGTAWLALCVLVLELLRARLAVPDASAKRR
jgi:membrane-associated phospholipid phosphatase